ncbi:PREDICTED: glutathione S-transferase U16-like [Tarenaya hassleriana]|uniref:glutathione S-transferase U16-like n=1 Tax=Tarenaya hassleriana TaxID=28532 RepID=UPI00053C66E8|nr:PREDICTED: glutathione S-transferase U16-like [Tarenaya hassleriana]
MEKREEVRLLGAWYSPYTLRAKIALQLKSQDYESVEENMFGSKSQNLLESNPVHKKVPVLIHNSKPVCESMVIVQYIDETWDSSGPSILPSDPYLRAISRFWSSFVDDVWFAAFRAAAVSKSEDTKAKLTEEAGAALGRLEEAFASVSQGRRFFGGESIGFIDIALGSFMVLVKAREKLKGEKILDEIKTPSLHKWADDFLSSEAVRKVAPEIDKVAEFLGELEVKAQSASRS